MFICSSLLGTVIRVTEKKECVLVIPGSKIWSLLCWGLLKNKEQFHREKPTCSLPDTQRDWKTPPIKTRGLHKYEKSTSAAEKI